MKNPRLPSRETLARTLKNAGGDLSISELEAIYSEFAKDFEKEASLPVTEGERWLPAYYQMVETFLAKVHQAMKSEGITAAELARRLGVSRAWVSKALSGDAKNFQLATVAKLACALDLKVTLEVSTWAMADQRAGAGNAFLAKARSLTQGKKATAIYHVRGVDACPQVEPISLDTEGELSCVA